ncbi:hypothetical protein ACO0K7_08760 [Undibacterium sp. Ji67W]|uniref:hypothetical protein n=1 Tax=Undibacterium sp. Ji67W TaxID=3413042 RepID=UPI003BEF7FD6
MHKKHKPPPFLQIKNVSTAQSDLLIKENKAKEAALDEALWETFPASDPIAISITPVEKVLPASRTLK